MYGVQSDFAFNIYVFLTGVWNQRRFWDWEDIPAGQHKNKQGFEIVVYMLI
jgi:hypothetical protein